MGIIEYFNNEKEFWRRLEIEKISDIKEISMKIKAPNDIDYVASIYFAYKNLDISLDDNTIKFIFTFENDNITLSFQHNSIYTLYTQEYPIMEGIYKLRQLDFYKNSYKIWIRSLKIDSLSTID